MAKLGPAARDTHLARIASLGIDQVRFNASWAAIEPRAPVAGVHSYRWGLMDEEIAAMARHYIKPQPTLTQTPNWDAVQGTWVQLQCSGASSGAPVDAAPYAAFVRAFAGRYGRGGTFWSSHLSLPYDPVVRYEIWNEPNLKGGWCPRPQPWLYAEMFIAAAQAIRTVDPQALVYTGGVATPSGKHAKDTKHYLGIADFFANAIAARPRLAGYASAVAVHIYPALDALKQLQRLAWFRSQLHAGYVPDRMPMLVSEIGWATHVGSPPIAEAERADSYGAMTVNYPRTNCNVAGILPHTWTSAEQNTKNPEDWFGIANPSTAKPYESAKRYSARLRLMRGQTRTEPPRLTLMACPGMPLPDSDHDGYPDQNDYYPFDPTRH